MAKILVRKYLGIEDLPQYNRPGTKLSGQPVIEMTVDFPLQDVISRIEKSAVEYKRTVYYTNDLRQNLDQLTDGLFTSLYANSVVSGHISFTGEHCPLFRLDIFNVG